MRRDCDLSENVYTLASLRAAPRNRKATEYYYCIFTSSRATTRDRIIVTSDGNAIPHSLKNLISADASISFAKLSERRVYAELFTLTLPLSLWERG